MVDLLSFGAASKVVEGSAFESSGVQDSGEGEDFGPVGLGVEVSDDNPGSEWQVAVDQVCALLSCFFRFVIPVGVEKGKGSKIDPATDSGDVVPPAFASRFVRRIAEPKGALVERSEAALAPEDAAGFALVFSVIAADGVGGVVGELFEKILELEVEVFLKADDVGVGFADCLGSGVAAQRPGVVAVIGEAVANVEGEDCHFG